MPEPAPYTIRDYRPEDEDAVLALLRLTLGEGYSFTRDTAFWRWKHLENPFGTSQLLLAANGASNGHLLGLRAFMRWAFRTPGGRVRAVRAVDTSTHPEARRAGIFSHLTRVALDRARADGVHLVFNTPNPQSMAGYLKLGWQWVGRPQLLMRPLRPVRIAAVLARRITRRPARGRLAPADVPTFFRATPREAQRLVDQEEPLEALISADDELRAGGIRTDRSPAFLRWRYGSAPSTPYFAHWIGEEPRTGLVVFRPSIRGGLREVMVCELLIDPRRESRPHAVIEDLVRMVQADYLVAAALAGTAHWRALRQAGFLPVPRVGPNLTVLPLLWPDGVTQPGRLQSWQFSLGDLEAF